MSRNPTAGIGDPYWYEWSVGLSYLLKMLYPDSEIVSVSLQSHRVQGLDDVVVKYSDGRTRCIQIKHSRTGDTLTFGDLVSVEKNERTSLLGHLAEAWLESKQSGWISEAVLFTNRPGGTRAYTTTREDGPNGVMRPGLTAFWAHLHSEVRTATRLDDITLPIDWGEAWGEWCAQLDCLDESDRLEFLKALSIETGQPDLTALESLLLDQIATAFGVSVDRARAPFYSLTHALRTWTTSRRTTEWITREMLFDAISSNADELVGDHSLPPPEPFFPSRQDFTDRLAAALLGRTYPVLFLTGAPGYGKTSIVSALSNRHAPVIDLRFYAFRPITPESLILPADAARTTTARALWGDLLCQLRLLFKGQLAKFQVPVRNDFLADDIPTMRAHVLRLASLLASERGRPTVIAIDGIDHAARAGLLRPQQIGNDISLLDSLVPPDAVPEGVCFLIAGQPAVSYESYPHWLKHSSTDVQLWMVPDIEDTDVRELIKEARMAFPEDQLEAAVRVVNQVAAGNTLAAVFAVHEAKNCDDVTVLQRRLENRRLGSGVAAYYDEIWKAAIRPLQSADTTLGDKLASCISLSSERLTGALLHGFFPELSAFDWSALLRRLSPLLIEEHRGFRVFHNDFRVHLTRQILASPTQLSEIASRMADYYWHTPESETGRHADLFRLLELSGRQLDLAEVFTPVYVMEGWAIGRPMAELLEQCRSALEAVIESDDWTRLHTVSCAVATLAQLRKTLQWADREVPISPSPGIVPPVLLSEGRVQDLSAWSLASVGRVLADAETLIEAGELNRARGLMKRWLKDMSPLDLMAHLPLPEISDQRLGEDGTDEMDLGQEARHILEQWGRISQSTGRIWRMPAPGTISKLEHSALAAFFSGWLKEAASRPGKLHWTRSLNAAQTFYFDAFEQSVEDLAEKGRWLEVALTLRRCGHLREQLSEPFLVQAGIWALLCRRADLVNQWVEPLLRRGFAGFSWYDSRGMKDNTISYVRLCFIVGWTSPARPAGGIVDEALNAYYASRADERHRGNLSRLFYASAWIGRLFGAYATKGAQYASEIGNPDELGAIVKAVLNPDPNPAARPLDYRLIMAEWLEAVVHWVSEVGGEYDRVLLDALCAHGERFPIDLSLEPTWRFLMHHGHYDLLRRWFDHWLGRDGIAWYSGVGERAETAERLSQLARDCGWADLVEQVRLRQAWGWIGYSGHKEYSVHDPLRWFRDLMALNPQVWLHEGLRLLAISQEVSRVGDNRLSTEVEETVAAAAACSSVTGLWQLMNANHPRRLASEAQAASQVLLNGIIGLLKSGVSIDESSARALWAITIGSAAWQDRYESGSLRVVRDAIIEASARAGVANIAPVLSELGPMEYGTADDESDRQDSSERRAELTTEVEGLPLREAVRHLKHAADGTEGLSGSLWRAVAASLRRLASEHPADYHQLLQGLHGLLRRREDRYRWTYDHAHYAYEALLPLLDDTERWEVARQVVGRLDFDGSADVWIETATENLDYLCWYRARAVSETALRQGLIRLLDMHQLWIEGAGHLPPLAIPAVDLNSTDQPKDWAELGYRSLLGQLTSSSALTVGAALRGLWALIKTSPDKLDILATYGWSLPDDVKEWILLLSERVAASLPAYFPLVEPIVQEAFDGNVLALKLQAWVTLQAHSRVTNKPCPPWTVQGIIPVPSTLAPLAAEAGTVLLAPGEKVGSITFTRGVEAVHSVLRQLEAATDDDVDDLEAKLAWSLRVHPVNSRAQVRKKDRMSDLMISRSAEIDRLMEIIGEELRLGRWADVPVVRLAQALTGGEDPFVVLESAPPSANPSEWPVEDDLDNLIGTPELEKRLSTLIRSGLTDRDVVLGAQLQTYSRHHDVICIHELTWKADPFDLRPIPEQTTFNGRCFALYDEDRFEPRPSRRGFRFTVRPGGLRMLPDESMWCYPRRIWQLLLDWTPSPDDPRVWKFDGKPCIRFERLGGPTRAEVHDLPTRQPGLQRWITTAEVLSGVKDKLGGIVTAKTECLVWPFGRT